MRGVRISVIVAIALAASVQAALGAESRKDLLATRAFVHARYLMVRGIDGDLPASESAMKAYVQQVTAECPGVLSGAPRGGQLSEFFQEEINAFEVAGTRPDKNAILAYDRAVHNLRWSNRKLTRRILRDAQSDRSELNATMPTLCEDLKAWAASGYRSVPATTRQLADGVQSATEEPELIHGLQGRKNPNRRLWSELRPFIPHGLRQTARRTQHLEGHFALTIFIAVFSASNELDRQLGLQ